MIRITGGVGLLLLLATLWGAVRSAPVGSLRTAAPASRGGACAWLPGGGRDALWIPLHDEFGDEYLLPRELVPAERRIAYA